jgi:hypothetical protein
VVAWVAAGGEEMLFDGFGEDLVLTAGGAIR